MNNQISNILAIIPQFYYDILAKFLPGIIVFEFIFWELKGDLEKPSSSFDILIGVIIIYIMGLCLDILGLLLSDCLDGIVNFILESFLNRFSSKTTNKKTLPNIDEIHEGMYQLKSPENETIIIKILSEIVLLRSLTLLPLFIIIFDYTSVFKSRYDIEIYQVSFLIFLALRIFLQIKAYTRIGTMKNKEIQSFS